jgi:hypothetical protein
MKKSLTFLFFVSILILSSEAMAKERRGADVVVTKKGGAQLSGDESRSPLSRSPMSSTAFPSLITNSTRKESSPSGAKRVAYHRVQLAGREGHVKSPLTSRSAIRPA